MSTQPVSIATNGNQQRSPAHSTSTLSTSPQTPLPPLVSPSVASPGLNPLSHWSSGFSTFGKSPPKGSAAVADRQPSAPVEIPATTAMDHDHMNAFHHGSDHGHGLHHDDDHHFEQHDSFEFGDFGDMRNKSWTSAQKGRRAVSMSMASGQTASGAVNPILGSSPPAGIGGAGGGSVMSMLTGFGAGGPLSPGGGPAAAVFGSSLSSSLGSPNGLGGIGMQGGVMADKAAKAQGVIRRLSLSGSFQRPGFIAPSQQSGQLPPSPPTVAAAPPPVPPAPAVTSLPSASNTHGSADEGAKAAARGMMNRGRRNSDNGAKKRGVSPMGERILRDHGHF